jgi:excisionase family DNA binding protein
MALKSIQHAAHTWGVSIHTVRRLAAVGLVRSVTVGRRRLISEAEIDRIAAVGVPSPSGKGMSNDKAGSGRAANFKRLGKVVRGG